MKKIILILFMLMTLNYCYSSNRTIDLKPNQGWILFDDTFVPMFGTSYNTIRHISSKEGSSPRIGIKICFATDNLCAEKDSTSKIGFYVAAKNRTAYPRAIYCYVKNNMNYIVKVILDCHS